MGLRVLVADDYEDSAESLGTILELWGHDVRAVHSGQDALDIAGGFRPHVMLINLGMPVMNGYEVAERIQKTPALRAVVLIAISGYGGDRDRRRCEEVGIEHHLVKPVEPDVLQGILNQVAADRGLAPPA